MSEQKFSTRQAFTLATMFIIGQTLIMSNGMPAKSDIWLSVLIAFAATLPLALMAARLTNVFPGRDLYDLQIDLFGRVIGRITSLLYVFFTLHVGSLILCDISNFIQITSLINTPIYVSAMSIIILCIYCVKAGINTLARYTAMAMPVFILILVGITLLSVTIRTKAPHLPPVLYNGFGPVWKSIKSMAGLSFFDLMSLPFVLQPLKDHRKAKAVYLLSSAVTAAFFIMIYVRNMFILGEYLTYAQYFPSYIVIGLIDIGDFLQRIEVAGGAVLFMCSFVKITVYVYVLSLGLAKTLGFGDYRKFAAPAGLLMAAFSLFAYPNIIVNLVFAEKYYPIYALPFRVFLPAAVWLAAEWKRKRLISEGRFPDTPPAADETPVARQDGGAPPNPDGSAAESPG